MYKIFALSLENGYAEKQKLLLHNINFHWFLKKEVPENKKSHFINVELTINERAYQRSSLEA